MSKHQPTLYMLIGIPGCGKSTWIDEKTENCGFYVHEVLSTDSHIERWAREEGKTYAEVFDKYIKDANVQLLNDLNNALKVNCDIYWDQTNLVASSRKKKLSLIPSHYRKIAVVFELPREEVDKQLAKREKESGKVIAKHVVDSMENSYQKVDREAEGFDEVWYVWGKNKA